MTITILLAGIPVGVESIHPQPFLEEYRTEAAPSFTVRTTQADIDAETVMMAKADEKEGRTPTHYSDAVLERTAIHRKISEQLLDYDILLFHGSAVAVDGQAYLFTAPSGTGKSTHTRLWREYLGQKAEMVNDDKPYLLCRQDGVWVCGSPWCGKHRLGSNVMRPLRAVCELTRAAENSIVPMRPAQFFVTLFRQSYHSETREAKVLELLNRICTHAGCYRLGCNMEPEAAQVSYRAMSGQTEV